MPKKFTINENKIIVTPKALNKTVKAPPSKSIMQRAIALSVLSEGRVSIKNPSFSLDVLSAIRVAGALGASVQFTSDEMIIEKTDKVTETEINLGESGLSTRMFSSILPLFNKNFKVDGKGSLLKRPIGSIKDALSQLGVSVKTNNGFLPLEISGNLKGGKIKIEGSSGSQVLSGLLIALPKAKEDSEIIVSNLKSKPYIDLTINMIQNFGGEVERFNYEKFIIKGQQKYFKTSYTVEGDWSGAAFLLVAGLISGKMKVEGLNINSLQADKEIVTAIKKANGHIFIKDNSIKTIKSKLKAFEFDATDCPDLFPPLVAMASYCNGISKIKGVSRLKHKESDRAVVLQNEFSKIGINITIQNNIMLIEGGKPTGGTVDSNNDHRIAMAAGVAALGAENEITIINADSVNKSYTRFFRDIK